MDDSERPPPLAFSAPDPDPPQTRSREEPASNADFEVPPSAPENLDAPSAKPLFCAEDYPKILPPQKLSSVCHDIIKKMITKDEVIKILKAYEDPELMIDVWTLGLIYDVNVDNDNNVKIKMTYTTPSCPWGPQMTEELTRKLKEAGAKNVQIKITFDPPWQPPEDLRKWLGV
jgi:metal-sulfur cluster biosynthetic enzyme